MTVTYADGFVAAGIAAGIKSNGKKDLALVQNLGPLGYLTGTLGVNEEQKLAWIRHWIDRGLSALEQEIADLPERACVFGDTPSYADCCLVPQPAGGLQSAAHGGVYRNPQNLDGENPEIQIARSGQNTLIVFCKSKRKTAGLLRRFFLSVTAAGKLPAGSGDAYEAS